MNQEKYLRRIGISKKRVLPDLESLKFLQRQHLLRVPFENLDIYWKRPITLDNENFYRKIIEENRGGFCYELNGLFYELLKSFDFQSKLISARVTKGNGEFGPKKDHMAILTKIEDDEYLVDVGFGSFIAEPLKIISDAEQEDLTGTYLITKYDDKYYRVAKKEGEKWIDECLFTTEERKLAEFSEMCNFHQTSPESHFTKNRICSLMTADGRKTLAGDKFIETKDGKKIEKPVNSNEDFNNILEKEFNIKPVFSSEIV